MMLVFVPLKAARPQAWPAAVAIWHSGRITSSAPPRLVAPHSRARRGATVPLTASERYIGISQGRARCFAPLWDSDNAGLRVKLPIF